MQSINELEILLKNIKTLREINHLSKKEMASILNISINTLNRIEKEIMPKSLGVNVLINIFHHFKIYPQT
ncbi:MAG: helix-turn-helix transcriptional regulator [Clostridia bacterium]|nr:helix-turn-helix transcriptional regulator [Clostridia bacterium]